MNKTLLTGNLTRDPELQQTSNGTSVCHFSIAVKRNYKNSDGEAITDFFNCVAWRGLADTIAKYTAKGNKIAIVGSIENRSYEDKDGNKRTVTEINAQEVEFLTSKAAESKDTDKQPTAAKKVEQIKMTPVDDDYNLPF